MTDEVPQQESGFNQKETHHPSLRKGLVGNLQELGTTTPKRISSSPDLNNSQLNRDCCSK